jgi:hypothetical protein
MEESSKIKGQYLSKYQRKNLLNILFSNADLALNALNILSTIGAYSLIFRNISIALGAVSIKVYPSHSSLF